MVDGLGVDLLNNFSKTKIFLKIMFWIMLGPTAIGHYLLLVI